MRLARQPLSDADRAAASGSPAAAAALKLLPLLGVFADMNDWLIESDGRSLGLSGPAAEFVQVGVYSAMCKAG